MKFPICFSLLFLFTGTSIALAQHDHAAATTSGTQEPISFTFVRNQLLTDPALKGYKMESSVMTIAPGVQDTVSHRHDCDVFGYVLEGEVQIGLEHKSPDTYKAGQMFFERSNILHTLAGNALKDGPSRILLIFIIKSGRESYIPAYPKKASQN